MQRLKEFTTLFLDIGGVLLTNGWDHEARKRAAMHFELELAELEDRHHLAVEAYEEGKITLDEYLGQVVFCRERSFTRNQFREFMFGQSRPDINMIELVRKLKIQHELKIAVVNNEARELNSLRIRTFKLDGIVDCFISSCFVHVRKPDAGIFQLALDITQAPARRVVYIDGQPPCVQAAEGLGIRSIHHTDYKSTSTKLASFGLDCRSPFWSERSEAGRQLLALSTAQRKEQHERE